MIKDPEIQSNKPSNTAGFTLVETLVVVFIIGVLIAVASLSFGVVEQREFRGQADQLRLSLQHAADSALFQQATYGLHLRDNGYQIVEHTQGQWQTSSDQPFKANQFPSSINLSVIQPKPPKHKTDSPESDDQKEEKIPQPIIVFYPSGEYTPFHIQLESPERTPWQLEGNGLGKVTVTLASDE